MHGLSTMRTFVYGPHHSILVLLRQSICLARQSESDLISGVMKSKDVHDTDDLDLMSSAIVGVCGAGIMGAGIAQVFASSGNRVLLFDAAPGVAERATNRIERDLRKAVDKGKIDASVADRAVQAITVVDSLESLAPAALVVEAVIEDLGVKQDLFQRLEKICTSDATLVTNTSTLSPTEIANVLERPERAAGVHFFNPAPRMELVELIPGHLTASTTVEELRQWLTRAGKHVVCVQESPGGIVSRLQLLVRNEAVRMVAERVASAEDIDAAMRLGAGWPLGPLELIDLVGVDMHVKNCDSLARELGSDRYAPHPLVRKLMRAGQLGRKTKRGFYTYDAPKRNQ